MAVLEKPVALNVIQAYRGIVDFYYWKDLPVARSWPRKANPTRTTSLLATHAALRASHVWKKAQTPGWHALFSRVFYPAGYCREDFKRKIALRLSYAGQLIPVAVPQVATVVSDPVTETTTLRVTYAPLQGSTTPQATLRATLPSETPRAQQWKQVTPTENRYRVTHPTYAPVFENFLEPLSLVHTPYLRRLTATFAIVSDSLSFFLATNIPSKPHLPTSPVLPAPLVF